MKILLSRVMTRVAILPPGSNDKIQQIYSILHHTVIQTPKDTELVKETESRDFFHVFSLFIYLWNPRGPLEKELTFIATSYLYLHFSKLVFGHYCTLVIIRGLVAKYASSNTSVLGF